MQLQPVLPTRESRKIRRREKDKGEEGGRSGEEKRWCHCCDALIHGYPSNNGGRGRERRGLPGKPKSAKAACRAVDTGADQDDKLPCAHSPCLLARSAPSRAVLRMSRNTESRSKTPTCSCEDSHSIVPPDPRNEPCPLGRMRNDRASLPPIWFRDRIQGGKACRLFHESADTGPFPQ